MNTPASIPDVRIRSEGGRLLFLLLMALLWTAHPARADTIARIYAKDYTVSWDVPGTLTLIGVKSCQGALTGRAVYGMDGDGEWVEFPLHLGEDVTWVDSLRSAGALVLVRRFAVLFLDPVFGDVYAADTLTTIPGLGLE